MKDEELIQKLAQSAKAEQIPVVDVSGRVLERIQMTEQSINRPLTIFTGASALAASVVLFFAYQTLSSWQDPIAGLFTSFDVVLQ